MRLFRRQCDLDRWLLIYISILLTVWFIFFSPSCPQSQIPSVSGESTRPKPSRPQSMGSPADRAAGSPNAAPDKKVNGNSPPSGTPRRGSGRNFAKYWANAPKIASRVEKFGPDEYLAQNESFFDPKNHEVKDLDLIWLTLPPPCPSGDGKKGPLSLVVVVPSMDGHWERRKAIRETWGSPAYGHPWPGEDSAKLQDSKFHLHQYSVKVVFLLGVTLNRNLKQQMEDERKVEWESETYKDIARASFSDTYQHLSLKTVSMLQWADTYCKGVRYLIKVDEDTFVNIPLLLRVLDLFSSNSVLSFAGSPFVLGRRHSALKPNVDRTGKWMVTNDEYPLEFFPHYAYGHSYVISGDAIRVLTLASRRMPLVVNEDAYVTGILTKTAGVIRYHSWDFARVRKAPDMQGLSDGRLVSQTMFTELSLIYEMWEQVKASV